MQYEAPCAEVCEWFLFGFLDKPLKSNGWLYIWFLIIYHLNWNRTNSEIFFIENPYVTSVENKAQQEIQDGAFLKLFKSNVHGFKTDIKWQLFVYFKRCMWINLYLGFLIWLERFSIKCGK